MNSNANPFFTIVFVSYNQVEFVERALQSVFNQDSDDFELIIMDGGSTDGSLEIIRKYAHLAAYWQSQPDGGAAKALNAGFLRAKGAYFCYLNSDDVIDSNTFSTWRTYIETTGADVLYGDIRIINSLDKPTTLPGRKVSTFKATPFNLRRMAAGGCAIPQQAACWKASVHQKIGGFVEENRSSWDGEFFVDAAISGFRFHHIPKTLASFRVHGESISGTGKNHDCRIRDHARIKEKWENAGFRFSKIEKFFLVKLSQVIRSFRYLTD